MTDEVIIKGLDHCSSSGECKDCPANPRVGNFGYCTGLLMKAALDLINRQKAEIERLREEADGYEAELESEHLSRMDNIHELIAKIEKAKSEAIKEFAERIESELANNTEISSVGYQSIIAIINLVKEMTEEN